MVKQSHSSMHAHIHPHADAEICEALIVSHKEPQILQLLRRGKLEFTLSLSGSKLLVVSHYHWSVNT